MRWMQWECDGNGDWVLGIGYWVLGMDGNWEDKKIEGERG